jgi:hypothetical protein
MLHELASMWATRRDRDVAARLRETRAQVPADTARPDHQRSHRGSVLAEAHEITRAPQVRFSSLPGFVGLSPTLRIDQVTK